MPAQISLAVQKLIKTHLSHHLLICESSQSDKSLSTLMVGYSLLALSMGAKHLSFMPFLSHRAAEVVICLLSPYLPEEDKVWRPGSSGIVRFLPTIHLLPSCAQSGATFHWDSWCELYVHYQTNRLKKAAGAHDFCTTD